LLHQQKIADAESAVRSELTTTPDSVPLLVALGEVQYRQGKIAEAAGTADKAYVADKCNARVYLLRSRIFRLNSMYASENRALGFAHALDPTDIEIINARSQTIPLAQHIEEQKKILAATDAKDASHDRAEKYLAFLETQEKGGNKSCAVSSNASSAEMPLIAVMSDEKEVCDSHGNCGTMPKHIQGWGLHVFLNNREASLEVDSGASGLLISRAVAERSGLKPEARTQVWGIGDQGAQGGFVAQVDAIRIGSLEFKNCTVTVTDRKEVLGIDGVIGTDVFSNYLVTLDYPISKMFLAPLPTRPNDSGGPATLKTDSGDQGNSASGLQDRYMDPSMKDYVPFFRAWHDIIIPVVLNHKVEHLFMVDTGNFSSSISPETAREVTKVKGGSPLEIQGMSGKVSKVATGDVVVFQFAGIQQQNNNLISYDTSHLTRSAGFEISGFLGSTILNELTIHIDYRDGLIKFDYDVHHGHHNL
jgi:hypothetical protein